MSEIQLQAEELCVFRGYAYEEEINTVVKYFGGEKGAAYEHNYWLSHPIARVIVYTFDESDAETDKMFVDYCHELLPSLPELSHFTLSLFHEIGHWFVMMFEGEGDDALEIAAPTESESQYWYMRKPQETAATMWGLCAIMRETEIVLEFDKYIKEIREYYGI